MVGCMRLFLTALIVLAAACGGDDTTETADTTSTSTTVTTSSSTTTTSAPETSCSTAGLRIELAPQDDLPAPVADMRRRIFDAAVACDFEELGSLANAGDSSFTAGFGGGEVPELWQTENDPLRILVLVLNMSPATTGEGVHVWPAAFARESWDDVPPAERDELASVYDDEAQADFSDFGAYIGYRAGITADGDWIFFVAGD